MPDGPIRDNPGRILWNILWNVHIWMCLPRFFYVDLSICSTVIAQVLMWQGNLGSLEGHFLLFIEVGKRPSLLNYLSEPGIPYSNACRDRAGKHLQLFGPQHAP